MELKISFHKIVYIYMALPVIIFMFTWIRPVIGIPAALLVVVALFFAMRVDGFTSVILPKKAVVYAVGIAFVWCFLAGQGGFWYQSDDHWARNAIFRDLIYHPWPVVFEQYDVLLNYYIGYWFVPALFGKLALLISSNTGFSWVIARIALLLWSTFSITLCFLLLAKIFNCTSQKHFLTAVIFFILFSGLDILGIYILNGKAGLHIERWCPGCQFSCFSTCLFWVFNQAVPAWIATLLLLAHRRIENFAFCGLCIFISSPIPLIGLFPIYVVIGMQEMIKTKNKTTILREIVSVQNIIACLIIFPICFLYFSDNAAVSKSGVPDQNVQNTTNSIALGADIQTQAASVPSANLKTKIIRKGIHLALFYAFEVGIYLLLLLPHKKGSALFWCLAVEFMILPIIHIGTSQDFCMRASIPPLVVLMTMVFDDYYRSYKEKNLKWTLYCIVLAFAILTPGKEFYRGFYEVYKHKQFANNTVSSIEDKITPVRTRNNFISYDYSSSLFYRYLAKNNRCSIHL